MTGTNADGSSQAASAASAVIIADPPVNTVAPSLTGSAQDGQTLTVTDGTWTGIGTITYTYQWQLSTDGGTTWSDIAGATANHYTPTHTATGKQLRVLVTATNADGSGQAATGASAIIRPRPAGPSNGSGSTSSTPPVPPAPAQSATPATPSDHDTGTPASTKPQQKQATKLKPKQAQTACTKKKAKNPGTTEEAQYEPRRPKPQQSAKEENHPRKARRESRE